MLVCAKDTSLIIEANSKAHQLLNRAKGELEGKRFSHFFSSKIWSRLVELGHADEVEMSTPSSELTVSAETYPPPEGMKEEEIVLLALQNLGNLKSLERQVQLQNRKIKEDKAKLEELIHIISHDLKEPLRTIGSYSDMLRLNGGNLDEGTVKKLKGLKQATQQMKALLSDLFRFSQLRRAREKKEVDITEVVDQVWQKMADEVVEGAEIEVQEDFPLVKFDRGQLEVLMGALIKNALQYNVEPKKVQVGCSRKDDGGDLTVFVKDNGYGILPAYQEKIFRMFERLDPEKETGGTGAGLAFCKHIVEGHGGNIWVESEPGKGSTFYFTLPEPSQKEFDLSDGGYARHCKRVAQLAYEVGGKMHLTESRRIGLYVGGLLHDVGRITIPDNVLKKAGELDEVEWELVKEHPRRGYERVLKGAYFPWPVGDMVLHHHERLDGSGYPDGLKGEELCLEVRIIGLCDVVEAMGSDRPYRPSRIEESILTEIEGGQGTKYDAEVAKVILQMFANDELGELR